MLNITNTEMAPSFVHNSNHDEIMHHVPTLNNFFTKFIPVHKPLSFQVWIIFHQDFHTFKILAVALEFDNLIPSDAYGVLL